MIISFFPPSVDIVMHYTNGGLQEYLRQLSLYSTDDGSRQRFFFYVGGKKIKIKFLGQLVLKERKIKKGKIDRCSLKMAIFRGKKEGSSKVNPARERKKLLHFFS